jgi:hypothetical protein
MQTVERKKLFENYIVLLENLKKSHLPYREQGRKPMTLIIMIFYNSFGLDKFQNKKLKNYFKKKKRTYHGVF